MAVGAATRRDALGPGVASGPLLLGGCVRCWGGVGALAGSWSVEDLGFGILISCLNVAVWASAVLQNLV